MAKVPYPGLEHLDCDKELSFRDFTNREFYSRPEYDFNNKVIYATCFSNEEPDADIFGNIKGATFIKCNLSNVLIPDGNTVIDCNITRFKVQNDLNDWIIDETNTPIKPIDFKIFEKLELPLPKPEDIPETKVEEVIDLRKEAEAKKVIDNEVIK
jgi:hypothetical protein